MDGTTARPPAFGMPYVEADPTLDRIARANGFTDLVDAVQQGRCDKHPAFESHNCPSCGTSAVIR